MTTFQDPQPQSRRAVRQNERGDAPEATESFGQFPAQAPFAAPAPQYADSDAQRDMWDTNARRAAQLPATPAPRAESAVTGRRAAPAASQPPAAAEPLTYSTASRQPTAPESQAFRTRLDAREAAAAQPAAAPTDGAGYRVRDFSPDSRRGARRDAAPAAPGYPPQVPATDLDYQTEVREGFGMPQPATPAPAPISQVPPQYAAPQAPPQGDALPSSFPAPQQYPTPVAYQPPPMPQADPAPQAQPVQQAAAPAQPVAPAAAPFSDAPFSDAPGEQTLSRRELRALLAEQEGTAGAQETRNEPMAWQAPAAASAPQPPAAYAQAPQTQQPAAPQPAAQQPGARQPAFPAPETQQPAAQPSQAAQQPAYPATRLPESAQPSPNTGMTNALAEFDALTAAPPAAAPQQSAPQQPAVQEDLSTWNPPTGHWSTQGDLDDDVLPETTINRRVGSGSTATNALVLPEIPMGSDIRGPLTSTGEVMLTGSIDLPRSLGSTGTSARIDHDGIDGLFDLTDHEVISTDSQPVRAIKAVSTHQTGGVTHTQKPKGTRALTVLLISASSMAVIVAGLLVAAFAFNIF